MAIPDRTSSSHQLRIDLLAIGIAMALAALIRLNILPQIRW
jgi:hypothetical protein